MVLGQVSPYQLSFQQDSASPHLPN